MSDLILSANSFPIDLLPKMDRSPGVHVSEIIRRICLDRGIYDESTELDPTRLMLGQAFERIILDWYVKQNPSRYLIPGEVSRDGIFGTPDAVDIEDEEIQEVKFTARSAGGDCEVGSSPPIEHIIRSDKYWKDWAQVMAYAYMLGFNRGKLILCHVKGYQVAYREWRRVFSKQELTNNWLMIRHY